MCISRTTTSKTAATFKPSAHLWRLELRVSPIIRIKPAESLYGGHAMAKVFLEMLAGLPQTPRQTPQDLRDSRKRQSIFRETCGSTRKRQSISRGTCGSTRKRLGKRRETCGTPANTKAFPVGLAPVVQAFPKTLCSLQPSIQAILQGLGASFFRSSSRCKDFEKRDPPSRASVSLR